ncbi:MAG: beta-lactamase family protein [Phycisphaerae bacterium]|nr:beta-lactamase family protein [Phycisphaerae bacterium]
MSRSIALSRVILVALLGTSTPSAKPFEKAELWSSLPGGAEPAPIPDSGLGVPSLRPFDQRIKSLMRRWQIPGAAVAVARDGRLVYARGFGLSDLETDLAVRPDAIFRIASISKPITRSAVFKLAHDGKLRLDDPALKYLKHLVPKAGCADERVPRVTIRHLLDHKGGWDTRRLGFDPMFRALSITKKMGTALPADADTIVRYMLAHHHLNHDPGTTVAYSNFGYCLLGRVIEKAGGAGYEAYVRRHVLAPAGIRSMRLGRSRLADRAPGEVRYHPFPLQMDTVSVVDATGGRVAWPDGGFYLEALDAGGGWVASAPDLVRFALKARPAPYPGNWNFNGSLPGTRSCLARVEGGKLIVAALFNSRPRNDPRFAIELTKALKQASAEVKAWPGHDLFRLIGAAPGQ